MHDWSSNLNHLRFDLGRELIDVQGEVNYSPWEVYCCVEGLVICEVYLVNEILILCQEITASVTLLRVSGVSRDLQNRKIYWREAVDEGLYAGRLYLHWGAVVPLDLIGYFLRTKSAILSTASVLDFNIFWKRNVNFWYNPLLVLDLLTPCVKKHTAV